MEISTTTVRAFQDEMNKIAYEAKHMVRAGLAGLAVGALAHRQGSKAWQNYQLGRAYAKAQREQGG